MTITTVITSVAFSVGMAFWAYLMRKMAPPSESPTLRFGDDLKAEYLGWQSLWTLSYMLLVALFTVAWMWLFSQFLTWRQSMAPAVVFADMPGVEFRVLPGLLLGLGLAIPAVVLLFKRLLGGRFPEFMAYSDSCAKCNQLKLMPLCLVVLAVILLPVLVVSLDTYTRFTEDRIVINRPMSLGEDVYSYNSVTHLAHIANRRIPGGNILPKPFYMVFFNNGDVWSTKDVMGTHSPQTEASLFEFLSKKSGLPIEELEFAP